MGDRTGSKIKDIYGDFLQVDNTNSGIDGTLRPIEDLKGTQGPFNLSSSGLQTIAGKFLQLLGPFGGTFSTLTLGTGAATGTRMCHTIAAESGTSDDFDTLTATNYNAGDIVFLTADTGDTIYITDAGNFLHPCYLDDAIQLPFMWDGSSWHLLQSGLILLDEQVASASATLDFTKGIGSAYSEYVFVLAGVRPATDAAALEMYTSTDGGSTFDSGAANYDYHIMTPNSSAATFAGVNSTGDTRIRVCSQIGNATNESVSGRVYLHNPANAAHHTLVTGDLTTLRSDNFVEIARASGRRLAITDVDAVQFLMNSGNIAEGTIRLYGVKH